MNIDSVLERAAPVLPVITIADPADAVALADALAAGGIDVLEITLRTDGAIDAIEAIRKARPEMIVGAGTVLSAVQCRAVQEAGGQFAVSPGFTPTLGRAAHEAGLPLLPGAVTAGEIQLALEHGLTALKFFPAAAAGGPGLLRNFAAVFEQVRFCPTGGIDRQSMNEYLQLPNVACVGGSWITASSLQRERDWAAITRRAAAARAQSASDN